MTAQDKKAYLARIKEHCQKLLSKASERTPGRWVHFTDLGQVGDISTPDGDPVAMTQERSDIANDPALRSMMGSLRRTEMVRIRNINASFIASCAGASEAGWQSTIGRITFCDHLRRNFPYDYALVGSVDLEEEAIISAWPEELLEAPVLKWPTPNSP
jgi:hypothetical protein